MNAATEDKFAIVGIGGIFPGAKNTEEFWENLLAKRVLIERLPDNSVERDVFFRPDVLGQKDKRDKSYTDLLATIHAIDFDGMRFRLPPAVVAQMDPNQKLSLLVAEAAIGFGGLTSVSKDRVSVFMGNTMIGAKHHEHSSRFNCDKFEYYLRNNPVFCAGLSSAEQSEVLSDTRRRIVGAATAVTEDSAPGILPNIIAARINSVFDLHGHAFVIDAACASGLAAIICGIQQLRLGEADAVICGAADLQNAEMGRIYFSGIGALSKDGSFPFDVRANGFVVGDGAGAVVIKRLGDAISANDRIFAVVSGYGQASDGKGKAIAAPSEQWQARAIQRAWQMAGVIGDDIELIEAHGTSTQVGDLSEVNALKRAFSALGAQNRNYCGLGSVKSNIGHLKSAAGIAGFLKVVLALDRKVLPPTANFQKESPNLNLAESPFYILSEAREWKSRGPRRKAGVSAFGFGGADYHIALEEFRAEDYNRRNFRTESVKNCLLNDSSAPVQRDSEPVERVKAACVEQSNLQRLDPVFFSANTIGELLSQIESVADELATGKSSRFAVLVRQNLRASAKAPIRAAFGVANVSEIRAKAAEIGQWASAPNAREALSSRGISFEQSEPFDGKQLAVLFPGQGSQYADMLQPIARCYPSVRQGLLRADALWQNLGNTSVSSLIDSSTRGKQETNDLLRNTQNTHPVLVAGSLAAYRLFEDIGVEPAVMVGHSVGEFTALIAARRLSFAEGIALVHARANAFSLVNESERGAMLALSLNVTETELILQELQSSLAIANVNSFSQTIVSGSTADIERLGAQCEKRSIRAVKLNVSHAFHSPLMVPAERAFQDALRETRFHPSNVKVIANASNRYYADEATLMQAELEKQITDRVGFVATIQRLYDDGIRVFLEVGPGNVLAQLTRDILGGKRVVVISSDSKRAESTEPFVRAVCTLFASGIQLDPTLAVTHDRDGTGQTRGDQERQKNPHDGSSEGHAAPPRVTGVVNPESTLSLVPPFDPTPCQVVYSGVSIGLPGSFKSSFRDDNFEQLCEGRNFIERLTDAERQRLVDLRVSKVVKSEVGATFATLSSLNEVIQLAGKMGKLDLLTDYFLEEKDIATMSSSVAHAIAAGYEALRDAQIPLVHEYSRTAGGSVLPERWALPKEMQRHTGVIFANGFPMIEPIIKEVSRCLSYQLGSRTRKDLFEFYDSLIGKVSDRDCRKLLSDWYALNHSRLGVETEPDQVYRFNHQLMTQIAMQANNRLARCINARGPNFQLNAACSSTATAVTLAEELIRAGRAKRMIIIGADDPTSEHVLPYLGAGFLSTGASTNASDLYEAALPFDKRRNGMIMGAGAVGIVVESQSECEKRGITPLCDLMGTHCFNTAGHSSQLDVPRYAEELDVFVTRMEGMHGIRRDELAKSMVYVSHETYTPPRGGCAEAEAVALRHVFKEAHSRIEISNTKGMTGHTMGASIEDAVAAKALQFGLAPPVVNHRVPDPALEGLKLSTGAAGDHQYALRMAAGFGSQGNYILLRRRARGKERIADSGTHKQWLKQISGLDKPELSSRGRLLVVKDSVPGSIVVERPNVESLRPAASNTTRIPPNPPPNLAFVSTGCEHASNAQRRSELTAPSSIGRSAREGQVNVRELVTSVVAHITGYDAGILELDMELEADLGVDTVKQATVLATLAERLSLENLPGLRLSEYPTLRKIVELCEENLGRATTENNVEPSVAEQVRPNSQGTTVDDLIGATSSGKNTLAARPGNKGDSAPSSNPTHGSKTEVMMNGGPVPQELRREVAKVVLSVVADVTGYAVEMIGQEMELEADLGIDTVKQATILAMLGEKFALTRNTDLRMSDYTNVGQLTNFFASLGESPQNSAALQSLDSGRRSRDSSGHLVGAKVHESSALNFIGDGEVPASARATTLEPHPSRTSLEDPAQCVALKVATVVETNATPTLQSVIELLFATIGRITPYPAEMLETDLKLVDDLELSSLLLQALHAAICEAFRLSNEWRWAPGASLGEIAQAIYAHLNRTRNSEREGVPNGSHLETSLGRMVLQLCPAPLVATNFEVPSYSKIWVIGDNHSYVSRVASHLKNRCCDVQTLVVPISGNPEDGTADLDGLFASGVPQAIVDVTASPSAIDTRNAEPSEVLLAIARASDFRFALFKRLAETNTLPERVLAVTAIDGAFALGESNSQIQLSAIYGIFLGFYKSIRKEWPLCYVNILDVDPALCDNTSLILEDRISLELWSRGPGVEVCYVDEQRQRVAAVERLAPREVSQLVTKANAVTVLTGGGSGITSKIAIELAREYGGKFALIGRSKLSVGAKDLDLTTPEKVAAEKIRIAEEIRAAGGNATPRQIESQFQSFVRSAEVVHTLATLEQLGCVAKYYEADVCDLEAMRRSLHAIRQELGPIEAVVHGAGIEISHRLERKTLEEFRRVHCPKTVGAYYLQWLCRAEPITRAMWVSSISGRFGNTAQIDYAAGNAFMDLLARAEQRRGVHAISLSYSGWREVGMAVRSSFVQKHAELMGLNLILPDAGARAARYEFSHNAGTSDVVLHRGLGSMADSEQTFCGLSDLPFIDWIDREGERLVAAYRRFSPARDAILEQHRFASVPYMPGVGFMEMMAETAVAAGAARGGAFVFSELVFLEGFKLHREEPRDVQIDVARTSDESGLRMTVRSRVQAKLRPGGDLREYARTTLRVHPIELTSVHELDAGLTFERETTYKAILENARGRRQNVQLGPLLNEANRADKEGLPSRVRYSRSGIETIVPLPCEQLTHERYPLMQFLVNPAFLDALHQAGAVLAIELTGHVYLPVGAEEFIVYAAPNKPGNYRVVAQLMKLDDQSAIYNMSMSGEDGTLYARITNSQFRRIHD